MPTPEEVAHAVAVLQAFEAGVEAEIVAGAAPVVALTPITVALGAPVAVAAPSEPVKTIGPMPALIAQRVEQLREALYAYLAYEAGSKTQHESDADVRAFDQAQMNSLLKAFSI